MNKLDIDQLLEKFWSAETTEQEEKELKAYFEQAEIDESHTYAAPFLWTLFRIIVVQKILHT